MMRSLLVVAIGGAAGSVLRYLASVFTSRYFPGNFPTATFAVNAIGCLIMGGLLAYFSKSPDQLLRLLLLTGFCGGFTTFSAFGAELFEMVRNGQHGVAISYALGSVLIGICAVAAGFWLVDNTVLKG